MSMVWTLSFKDPLLGLANVKWRGGISMMGNGNKERVNLTLA